MKLNPSSNASRFFRMTTIQEKDASEHALMPEVD
jgi:hypothetical protein